MNWVQRALIFAALSVAIIPIGGQATPILETVQENGNTVLTGVQDVMVGLTSYDVQFAGGSCNTSGACSSPFFFNSYATAAGASTSLANVLNGSPYQNEPSLIQGCTSLTDSGFPQNDCQIFTPYLSETTTTPGYNYVFGPVTQVQLTGNVGVVSGVVGSPDSYGDMTWASWSLAPGPNVVADVGPATTLIACPGGDCGSGPVYLGYWNYGYNFTGLSGTGDIYIPILDPSALLNLGGGQLITDPSTIDADWPGSGNSIPGDKSAFIDPPALLEFAENGSTDPSILFTDSDAALNGPILADGGLIDPLIPGTASVPEPWSLSLFAVGLLGLAGMRRCKQQVQRA
jgi:hypothetical protein